MLPKLVSIKIIKMSFLPSIILGCILFLLYKWWNKKLQKDTQIKEISEQEALPEVNNNVLFDFTKYDKAIDKIARDLKSGKIKQGNIGEILEKELGIKFTDFDIEADNKRYQQMEDEYEKDRFFSNNYELYEAFQSIFKILHDTKKLEDPFSIKYNSFKIVEKFEVLKKWKDSELYSKVLLFTISDLKEHYPEINITPEMVKVLKAKYIN